MNILYQSIQHTAVRQSKETALMGFDPAGVWKNMDFETLLQAVESTAQQLKDFQVRCIALRAENSTAWAILDLAALSLDIVIIPVPMFFSQQQMHHLLSVSPVDCLVGDWSTSWIPPLHRDTWQATPTGALLGLSFYTYLPSTGQNLLTDTVKVTFTSGSTGDPKGVCLSAQNLHQVTRALAQRCHFLSGPHLVALPLSTLLENISGIYVPLLLGIPTIVLPGEQIGLFGSSQFKIENFATALIRYQPKSMVLTPALLQALIGLKSQNIENMPSFDCIAVGGAKVSTRLLEQAKTFNLPVYEGYGLSELASVVCLNSPEKSRFGSVGQPLDHVEVRINDDQELEVRGNIALGTIGVPFTAEWLATGDLASIDADGYVWIQGRKKNVIITEFGRNISPEWIETEWQAQSQGGFAIVVGDEQCSLSLLVATDTLAPKIVLQLNQSLPDYAHIQQVFLVPTLRQIPHLWTANGRPIRTAIRQQVRDWFVQLDCDEMSRETFIRWISVDNHSQPRILQEQ